MTESRHSCATEGETVVPFSGCVCGFFTYYPCHQFPICQMRSLVVMFGEDGDKSPSALNIFMVQMVGCKHRKVERPPLRDSGGRDDNCSSATNFFPLFFTI